MSTHYWSRYPPGLMLPLAARVHRAASRTNGSGQCVGPLENDGTREACCADPWGRVGLISPQGAAGIRAVALATEPEATWPRASAVLSTSAAAAGASRGRSTPQPIEEPPSDRMSVLARPRCGGTSCEISYSVRHSGGLVRAPHHCACPAASRHDTHDHLPHVHSR